MERKEEVKSLGQGKTKYNFKKRTPSVLETFKNKFPLNDYTVTFRNEHEFSSLCVVGDTYIDIPRNTKNSLLGIQIKNLVGKSGLVYSYSNKDSRIVLRKFKNVRKTQKKVKVLELKFYYYKGIGKNEKKFFNSIQLTPDHLVMLRNGIFKEAQELKQDQFLMPFTRFRIGEYNHLFLNNGKEILEHRFVYSESNEQIYPVDAICHKDGCKINNEPSNLEKKGVPNNIENTCQVLCLKEAGYKDVYNMDVDDTKCFVANGILVHNCPVTNQPDFADHIIITYKPNEKCIESKSLKLYLGSYRNHKDFGEDICNEILNDLVKCCKPVWMQVAVKMTSRGGLSWEPIAWYKKELSDLKNLY